MNDLIGMVEQFLAMIMESQDEFSDDELEELFQTANDVMMFIQQAEQQESGQVKLPVPEQVPLNASMPSSNINSFGYNDQTGELMVKFNGEHERNGGPTYSYGGVPKEIFDLFQKGAIPARTNGQNKWGKWWKGKHPSMGASLYTLIKSANYPYKKVA